MRQKRELQESNNKNSRVCDDLIADKRNIFDKKSVSDGSVNDLFIMRLDEQSGFWQ